MLNRIEMEKAIEALGDKWGKDGVGVPNKLTATTEVYCVTAKVWKAAKIKGDGGCLCIRCLEKRLGRQLKPKDFVPDHIFNDPMLPGTALRRDRLSWYYKDKPIEQVLQRVEVMEAKRHG
jgi:hypothetical protein